MKRFLNFLIRFFAYFNLHFHWQNLNEKPTPKGEKQRRGTVLKQGRCWLSNLDSYKSTWNFRFEWIFFHRYCDIKLHLGTGDCDEEISFSIAIPYIFCFWLGFDSQLTKWICYKLLPTTEFIDSREQPGIRIETYGDREISLSVHNWALWWAFWVSCDCWLSETPWYQQGCFRPIDFLFGPTKYEKLVLDKGKMVIPMPEKSYEAEYELSLCTWKRKRWPWYPLSIAEKCGEVKIENGIPVPGKGENSWDCGQDATYGISCKARNKSELIGKLVESVIHDRIRYGGSELATG